MNHAIKTLKTRADSGDIDAMLELGKLYNSGDKYYDADEAKKWLKKAAEKGSDEAAYLIGCMYYEAVFGDYDYETAAKWFLKPAENGHAEAQLSLGLSYLELDKFEECYYWLKKSAEQDNGEAQYRYAIYADISDKEIEYWLNKCIKNGYPYAYNDLGRLYIYSEDCKDYAKGIEILTSAAEKGNKGCMYSLAECYFDGSGVERDGDKAFYWFKRAGNFNGWSCVGLGKCYLYGTGVKKNFKKAIKYFKKSGSSEAVYELGNCYFNGWGVERDRDNAKQLWQQAVEQGFEKAQKALAENFK